MPLMRLNEYVDNVRPLYINIGLQSFVFFRWRIKTATTAMIIIAETESAIQRTGPLTNPEIAEVNEGLTIGSPIA